jgi:competence protein ComFC
MRSWLIFEGPIRQALHQLKYRRNLALGDTLGGFLAEYAQTLNWQVDLVLPVPLGTERLKERGYNQIGVVAKAIAEINHLSYKPKAIVRKRETKSQVGLSILERKANVEDAFQADQIMVTDANILLIDDVATTGATMSACAKAIKDNGARSVKALTLARALPQYGLNLI